MTEVDVRALAPGVRGRSAARRQRRRHPVLWRPSGLGARVVLHSATKFLGGDVMGGVVAWEEAYARTLRRIRFAAGAVLHPLAGYLLLRGLATLPLPLPLPRVRVRAASATAALADRLAAHPRVARVNHPETGGPLLSPEVTWRSPGGDRRGTADPTWRRA
jgi:methionine-gamma-lyase